MEKYSKLFYAVITILVLGVIIFFVTRAGSPGDRPLKVVDLDGYPSGTTLSYYKSFPAGFPPQLMLEKEMLTYSGTISMPDGKTQTTVSYISKGSLKDITYLYLGSFPGNGFAISSQSITTKLSVIRATKGENSVIITIALLKDKGTKVTFQYE